MCKHHLNSGINWIQNQQVDRIIPVRSNLSLSPCTGREFRAKLIKPVWVNVHGDLSDKIFPDMDPSPVVCLRVQENIWMKKKSVKSNESLRDRPFVNTTKTKFCLPRTLASQPSSVTFSTWCWTIPTSIAESVPGWCCWNVKSRTCTPSSPEFVIG